MLNFKAYILFVVNLKAKSDEEDGHFSSGNKTHGTQIEDCIIILILMGTFSFMAVNKNQDLWFVGEEYTPATSTDEQN